VLPCDTDTASIYGMIKKRLFEKGKPIPENDIWIAAVAYQHGLTVISRDDHSSEVENLKFENVVMYFLIILLTMKSYHNFPVIYNCFKY